MCSQVLSILPPWCDCACFVWLVCVLSLCCLPFLSLFSHFSFSLLCLPCDCLLSPVVCCYCVCVSFLFSLSLVLCVELCLSGEPLGLGLVVELYLSGEPLLDRTQLHFRRHTATYIRLLSVSHCNIRLLSVSESLNIRLLSVTHCSIYVHTSTVSKRHGDCCAMNAGWHHSGCDCSTTPLEDVEAIWIQQIVPNLCLPLFCDFPLLESI